MKRKNMTKDSKSNKLYSIGIIGLVITLALNTSSIFFFRQKNEVFLSENWWSNWFPIYIVWIVLLIVAFSYTFKKG